MRRFKGKMNGEKYLGDISKRIFHNLDTETRLCNIDEIIEKGFEIPIESFNEAYARRFDRCFWCMLGEKKGGE